MFKEDTARRFDEISHLFLSTRKTAAAPSGASTEVVLWLAVAGCACNRGFIAAGVADALARIDVRCTLAEIGRGLPNAGYYFAFEPRDYLAPTLDDSRVITGLVDRRISFTYAIDPASVAPVYPDATVADAPHAVVVAFTLRPDGRMPLRRSAVEGVTRRYTMPPRGNGAYAPDAVVVFTESCTDTCARAVRDSFHDPYPDSLLFVAERRPAGEAIDGVAATAVCPRELLRLWGRRAPPTHPFFTDLVSRCLQMLSQRRKRGVKRARV